MIDLHELLDGPVFFPEGNPHPLTMQTLPLPMGHEMSGTIVDVGEGCKKFKQTDKGVRVAVERMYLKFQNNPVLILQPSSETTPATCAKKDLIIFAKRWVSTACLAGAVDSLNT